MVRGRVDVFCVRLQCVSRVYAWTWWLVVVVVK